MINLIVFKSLGLLLACVVDGETMTNLSKSPTLLMNSIIGQSSNKSLPNELQMDCDVLLAKYNTTEIISTRSVLLFLIKVPCFE